MLTGRRARAGGAGAPSAVNRALPGELDAIVAKALAANRSGGYESAATLAAELRVVGAMLDVRAGSGQRSARRARDAPAPRAAGRAVVVLPAIVAGCCAGRRWRRCAWLAVLRPR